MSEDLISRRELLKELKDFKGNSYSVHGDYLNLGI